ncbi:MAG: NAD(P)-dependent oxidoreductase [Moraxella sp.]|nr:NAD(P)-dependent oxidoreductase [Moraxella sp.]
MIGVIGLGNMGLSMAINLKTKGEKIQGYDISAASQDRARAQGIDVCADVKSLIEQVDIVILSLPKADSVLDICLGEQGIIAFGQAGLVVIDTSTSTAKTSQTIAHAFKEKNMVFMDAPVSGGPQGALAGTMSMVIGATKADYQRMVPLFDKMSAKHCRIGEVGAGNITKIGNNLLVAANLLLVAEVVSMAAQAGVEAQPFLQGINQGSGRSAVSEVNFTKWILPQAYDSGFTMALMRKDVALANELLQGKDGLIAQVIERWATSQTLSDEEDFNAIVKLVDDKLF